MRHFDTSFLRAFTAALVLTTNAALAQSSGGFGGSFGSDATPAVVAPPPKGQDATSAGGDSFGGSFGTVGGITPPKDALPPPPPDPPPVKPAENTSPIDAYELHDFGVPPTASLRSGQFHAPTPTTIPGATVATTGALTQAITNGEQIVIIDVLGGNYSLPGAYMAAALASGGDFNDRIQQQAAQWLGQITGNNAQQAIVIYCSDPNCWLSYNATLRTVNAGYTNVYWYRGGLQAWQMAGQPLYPSGL